jgi:hypothetical protein
MVVPVNLNKIGPRSYAKVLTQSDPTGAIPSRLQPGPLTHPRMKSVGPNDPSAVHRSIADLDPRRIDTFYPRLPTRYDARVFRAFRQDSMKQGSTNTQTKIFIIWEGCFSFDFVVQKPYASKGRPMLETQLHPNPTQCCDPIGHQAFTASFVDGRLSTIRNNNFKAATANSKRSSESGWTATNYEDVSF